MYARNSYSSLSFFFSLKGSASVNLNLSASYVCPLSLNAMTPVDATLAAANDIDHKRSSHRLNLLAGSCISEALALTNRSRMKARDILQVKCTDICYGR
jgi:hypothetical protein